MKRTETRKQADAASIEFMAGHGLRIANLLSSPMVPSVTRRDIESWLADAYKSGWYDGALAENQRK